MLVTEATIVKATDMAIPCPLPPWELVTGTCSMGAARIDGISFLEIRTRRMKNLKAHRSMATCEA